MSPTPQYEIKRLTNPTADETAELVTVLTAAFQGDPFGTILSGGQEGMSAYQFRANLGAAALGGEVHVACAGDTGALVGVAVWFGPGQALNSTAEQRAAGWDQFMEAGSEQLRGWWNGYFIPLVSKHSHPAYGPEYPSKTWDLHLLAVHPEWQRKGIARALMRLVEDQARETNSKIVLETTTDLDLLIYKRMGFEVKDKMHVESYAVEGGATLHFLEKRVS